MKIRRAWAMPNKDTFSIKPITNLIKSYILNVRAKKCLVGSRIIDPFAGDSIFNEEIDLSNDLDPIKKTTHHLESMEFLKTIGNNSCDLILFDPPYSPRQVSECYKRLNKTVNMQTTQASFWGNLKKEIARVTLKDGYVITCGWNSGGIGKKYGFEIIEILLVAHGGWHNDTIVTVERKE